MKGKAKELLDFLKKEQSKAERRYEELCEQRREIARDQATWEDGSDAQKEYDRLWNESDDVQKHAILLSTAIRGAQYVVEAIDKIDTDKQ